MKFIQIFGSNRQQDQRPLIEKGFSELEDWEFASMECPNTDLIFSNDPGGYDDAISYQKTFGGKLILNVLDIPEHLFPNVDLVGLKEKLLRADAITAISKTTQNQVRKFLGLDSEIVNNPAKEVFEVPGIYKKSDKLKFLHTGRRHDPNKRYNLIADLIQKYYFEDQLLNIGEDGGIGKVSGIVPNHLLCAFYNHADYVLVGTKNGGIELPIIEGLLAGKKIIAMNDCECAREFCPPEFLCDPNVDSMYQKIQEIESDPERYLKIIQEYQVKYMQQFLYQKIVDNIISVYEKIK